MRNYPAFICENGHVNSVYSFTCQDKFCTICGAKIISKCQNCNVTINGRPTGDFGFIGSYNAPAYCHNCGKPHPWTSKAIEAATYMVQEETRLSFDEQQKMIDILPDIVSETPKTQLASIRYKKIIALGGFIAEGLRDFAVSFACDAFRNYIGLP